jgi:hypothetical protein
MPVKPKSSTVRPAKLNPNHVVQFGLQIASRHHDTKEVTSVRCQFCVYRGREDKLGDKRKCQQTEVVKSWEGPYRTELFINHHEGQHSQAWTEYQLLSMADKSSYFDDITPYKETIYSHFGQKSTHLTFNINAGIVDTIIGDMFFHPDDHGGVTQATALKLFQIQPDGNYQVKITNPMQFHLAIDFVAQGLSFRQVAGCLTSTKAHTGLAKIGSINRGEVAGIVRVVCAINLQMLSTILNDNSTWAFSLANDASMHFNKSYFDQRVRVHRNNIIHNIHAVAIPMFDRHTGENKYNLVAKFFDVICPTWRSKLLGVGSDGASVMTGHLSGVVTRLEKEAEHKIYRTWCGLHQLDLVMHEGYDSLMNGEVCGIIHILADYSGYQSYAHLDKPFTSTAKANCGDAMQMSYIGKSLGYYGKCFKVVVGKTCSIVRIHRPEESRRSTSCLVVGCHCRAKCFDRTC